MDASFQSGFYGKLPALGDFVSRRLPQGFVDVWDQWLQSSLLASREQLGASWLDIYLTSPLWRFGLSPGVCGDAAWVGVLMPSVDKVGRYFPLTLAAPLADAEQLPHLFGPLGHAWFELMEQLALSCLDDAVSVDALDAALQDHPLPQLAPLPLPDMADGRQSGKFACHVGMASLLQLPEAFLDVSAGLLNRFVPQHSFWCSSGSERIGASLLLCEGLPPIDTFVALLTGDWQQRGWVLHRFAGRPSPTLDAPPLAAPASAASLQEAAFEFDFASLFDEPLFVDDEPTTRPNPRPSVAPVDLQWQSWGISVPGKKRSLNEDNLLEQSEAGLWAVADGMGGHKAGDVASLAIVDALAGLAFDAELAQRADAVAHSLQQVNAELCRLAAQDGDGEQIIGSTVVVLLASGNRCLFQWAGDSRLYRFRDGTLRQLTRDHSLLGDLGQQAAGGIDGGRCEIITRAVGADIELQLEHGECDAQAGDLFLLCSDGVDKELNHQEIEAVFRAEAAAEIAKTLIAQAEERGARDNVTVVIVAAVRAES